ncbi:unnamed protein product [Amoebophrya sp. A120]|nr:unnamed protein product [Amoebophrya sp. A120]|eukprot:GSA120T00012616001.1
MPSLHHKSSDVSLVDQHDSKSQHLQGADLPHEVVGPTVGAGHVLDSDLDQPVVKRVFSLGGIVEPHQVVHELRDAYCQIQHQEQHLKEQDQHIHSLEKEVAFLMERVTQLDHEMHLEQHTSGPTTSSELQKQHENAAETSSSSGTNSYAAQDEKNMNNTKSRGTGAPAPSPVSQQSGAVAAPSTSTAQAAKQVLQNYLQPAAGSVASFFQNFVTFPVASADIEERTEQGASNATCTATSCTSENMKLKSYSNSPLSKDSRKASNASRTPQEEHKLALLQEMIEVEQHHAGMDFQSILAEELENNKFVHIGTPAEASGNIGSSPNSTPATSDVTVTTSDVLSSSANDAIRLLHPNEESVHDPAAISTTAASGNDFTSTSTGFPTPSVLLGLNSNTSAKTVAPPASILSPCSKVGSASHLVPAFPPVLRPVSPVSTSGRDVATQNRDQVVGSSSGPTQITTHAAVAACPTSPVAATAVVPTALSAAATPVKQMLCKKVSNAWGFLVKLDVDPRFL